MQHLISEYLSKKNGGAAEDGEIFSQKSTQGSINPPYSQNSQDSYAEMSQVDKQRDSFIPVVDSLIAKLIPFSQHLQYIKDIPSKRFSQAQKDNLEAHFRNVLKHASNIKSASNLDIPVVPQSKEDRKRLNVMSFPKK